MEENNNSNRDNDNKNNKNKKGPERPMIFMLVIAMGLTLLFYRVYTQYQAGQKENISYSQFLNMLDDGLVDEVKVFSSRIEVKPRKNVQELLKEIEGQDKAKESDKAEATDDKKSDDANESDKGDEKAKKKYPKKITADTTYYVQRLSDINLVDRLEAAKEHGQIEYLAVDESSSARFMNIMSWVVMIGVFYIMIWLLTRTMSKGGGVMGVGKSNAKMYVEKKTGVTFEDVAGQEESKESLKEMVDFLHNPKKYLEIGAKLPKGALLVGPPGTGKTLLAKAVAGEANVPFFSLSGSDFVELYVGVGASRVRDLFKQANSMAPCIIFIDEIDAIGRSRDSKYGGGDSEREQTLNQLLSEMDGFDTSKGIVILAATNRPEILDKALLRPGRFDRRVVVEKPDLKGRIETLKVHAKNVKMDESVDFKEIALATSGAVGADLANIINEAALAAVKDGREYVRQGDLFESVEVVFAGKEKKDRILSKKEKQIVAYHETGHALCIALQKHTEPVQKITIIPRTMGSLGYVMQVPEEEKYLNSKDEMEADIVTFLAGRAAEAIKFDSVTTGASNDIEQATRIARSMITLYGMSEEMGMVALESVQNRYLDGSRAMNCSEETATKIDNEVRDMMKRSYDKAYNLLKEHEDLLDALAGYLIERETITGKEFMKIYEEITGETLKEATEDLKEASKEQEGVNEGTSSFAPPSEENNDSNSGGFDTTV